MDKLAGSNHWRIEHAGRGKIPPRSRKNCCRKMVLFPNALFLVTNFAKIIIKFKFSIDFSSETFKISQNFPTIGVFCPDGDKRTIRFVKSFEKYAKIKHFTNFWSIFWKFFENLLKNSQHFVFFVQTRQKINALFVKFHWEIS